MLNHKNRWQGAIAWIAILLLITLAGCGGGSSMTGLSPADNDGFSLEVLPDSFLADAPSGRFTLAVTTQPHLTEVEVRGVAVADLRACYFTLAYDPGRFDPQGVTPGVKWSGLAGSTAGGAQELLSLEILDEPGRVHYGLILADTAHREGITGDAVLARVTFEHLPYTPRTLSAPPITDGSRTEASWNAESQTLTWLYDCQGDYNQDGLVTVTDLTPVGQNFERTGPFPPELALSAVDGNDDGMITVGDITPIGQNFGRGVEGYDIFASPDPADMPVANDEPPAIDPIGHVPFSDNLGNPLAQRLMFAAEFPGLSGNDILWVRPVSDAAAGTPSTADLPLECAWVIRDVSAYATIQSDITYSSLAVIEGHPAIAYQALDGSGIYYQRALDPTGYAWGNEVLVDAGGNGHRTIALQEVAGYPAICHHGEDSVVEFVRAADSTGTSWLDPVEITTTAASGWDCHLKVINGNPAVCYQDSAAQSLMYARAHSPSGNDWATPTAIADLGTATVQGGGFSSLAVVDGNPAAAFFHPADLSLCYVSALDPDGSAWGDPLVADNGTDVGRWLSLAEVDGHPAISYEGDDGLCYIRANDPAGTGWSEVTFIDRRAGRGEHRDTSLQVVHGRPAISYYSGDLNADLMFTLALDPAGRAWSTPQVVDSYLSVGRSTNLVLIEDQPAISYLDDTNSQVKFAICLREGNLSPVAQFSINPNTVAVDEQFILDASRSYDPDGTITEYEWDLDQNGSFELSSGSEVSLEHSYPANGVYPIMLRVTDNSGAQHYYEQLAFVGEIGRPPVAALSADTQDIELGQSIHFDASGSYLDEGSIVLYEWDFYGDGDFEIDTGDTPTVDFDYITEGIHNAAVKTYGSNGLADIAQVCINVGNLNQRPIADLSAYPWWGNPPFTLQMTAAGSYDPDGTIVKYEWDCDGDGYYEYDSGTTATYDWLCEQYGAQWIKLRVTDNVGAQGTTTLLCSSNEKPVAKFSCTPGTGNAPLKVTCNGSASYDPDGNIVSYGWDVQNDGSYEKTGTGAPGTWQTELIWNGPVKIRLRVRDDMGGIADAIATIQVNKGWHVRTLDPVGMTGMYNNLAFVNGAPAIAYYEMYSRSLKFIRGTDTYGYNAWNMPVDLGPIAQKGYTAYDIDLEWVGNSRPAIAFAGGMSGNPSYVIAKDANGATWDPFITAWSGGLCGMAELEVVSGKPALAAVILGARLATAKDSLGTAWNSSIVAAPVPWLTTGREINMVIINGNPAMAYGEYVSGTPPIYGLRYVRANDPQGSTWGTAVWIDNKDHAGDGVKLAQINGRPAVAYVADHSTGGFEVRYKRAVNQNGTSWATAPVQVKIDGRDVLGLVTVDNRPAIGLVTCKGHDVMYFHSKDADGTSFPIIHIIDATDQNTGKGGMGGSMIVINGKPAISYHHGLISGLKYACWK